MCYGEGENIANAKDLPELPYSFEVPWDISKKDNLLEQEFVVNAKDPISASHLVLAPIDQFKIKTHGYYICINFKVVERTPGNETRKQLRDFLGDASTQGIVIPVVIKIENLGDASILFEGTLNTKGALSWNRDHIDRLIDKQSLPTGKYKISVKTTSQISIPPNVKTFLSIFTRVK